MKKIIVGLKRVIDYNVRVRVKSDQSGVEKDGVKMSINPFDETTKMVVFEIITPLILYFFIISTILLISFSLISGEILIVKG